MKAREELKLILHLIGKYNLPLSPILEYAINEKIQGFPQENSDNAIIGEEIICDEQSKQEHSSDKTEVDKGSLDIPLPTNGMKIVDYGVRHIAVIGETKPHKDSLKAMGGHFTYRTQWGPAWLFLSKKRQRIQAYIDGDTSVVNTWEELKNDEKKSSSRYIIKVEYPDGRVFASNLVWETLVDVVRYAGVERVNQLNIRCAGDNLVSTNLNNNSIYRRAQKKLEDFYVCTYSSTDMKYRQIEIINQECDLGLKLERVYADNNQKEQRVEEDNNEQSELRVNQRDRTKYSFEGGPYLNKRRFVLEVVRYYVRTHPHISYETLLRVFPNTLHPNKSNGVVKRYYDVMKKVSLHPDIRNRFFLKNDEIIELSNGMKLVVHNQWGDCFENFLNVAKQLYNVSISNEEINSKIAVKEKFERAQNDSTLKKDQRIGYVVRLFPSQIKGIIKDVIVNSRGLQKLVVDTRIKGLVEIDDLPYLYEVLKRK